MRFQKPTFIEESNWIEIETEKLNQQILEIKYNIDNYEKEARNAIINKTHTIRFFAELNDKYGNVKVNESTLRKLNLRLEALTMGLFKSKSDYYSTCIMSSNELNTLKNIMSKGEI